MSCIPTEDEWHKAAYHANDKEFIAKVKVNTARWANVAHYNKVREDLKNELLLRLAPIVLALLAGMVGL